MMSSSKELEVVRTLSKIEIPQELMQKTSIRNMLFNIVDAQEKAKKSGNALDRARKEEQEGNFFGNIRHGRVAAIRAAELDVAKSVGELSAKSAELLILNTQLAIVLNDQQNLLANQQNKLNAQTIELEKQNKKIENQQERLANQQTEISKANKGLLEAKGVTAEQARKLIGCVESIESAEINLKKYTIEQVHKVQISQEALSESLTLKMHEKNSVIIDMIDDYIDDSEKKIDAINQNIEKQKTQHNTTERQLRADLQLVQKKLVDQVTSNISNLEAKHQIYVQSVNDQFERNKKDFYQNLNLNITNVQKDTQELIEKVENKHCSDINAVIQQIEKQQTLHNITTNKFDSIIDSLQNLLNEKIEDLQTKQYTNVVSLEKLIHKTQYDLNSKIDFGLNHTDEKIEGLIDSITTEQQAQIKAVKEKIETQGTVYDAQFVHRKDYEKQITMYENQISSLVDSEQKARIQNYIFLAVLACLICVY